MVTIMDLITDDLITDGELYEGCIVSQSTIHALVFYIHFNTIGTM